MTGPDGATSDGSDDGRSKALMPQVDYEDLFAVASRMLPIGMVIVDPQGRIVLANRQIETVFGYAEHELLGRSIEMLVPAQLRAAHEGLHRDFLTHPELRRMGRGRDLRGLHKDGREILVEIGLAPVTWRWGTFVLASVVDITERKRGEQALADLTGRLKALMEHAGDGIAVLSSRGVVLDTNQRMAALLGRPIEEVRGRPIADFSRGETFNAKRRAFVEAVVRGGGQILGVEIVRPDGTAAIVDFSVSRVEIDAEPLVLTIGRDVTEQRRVERELVLAHRMEAVGRLAGGVAHDFNNVLAVISGYVEMAIDDLPAGSPIRANLEEVRRAGARAATLTRHLLAFSRQQVIQPTRLNLNDIVRDVEKMLRSVIGADIELRTRLAPDAGYVEVDAGQLEQVILNLVVNARDAMPTGGQLTIETANVDGPEASGDAVTLTVRDTGVGMAPAVRAHAFEPFFTTKDQGKGTGLGLSTVYGIVQQARGGITLDSAPGRGSEFRIRFPRVMAPTSAATSAPAVAPTVAGTETILLAEDDELLRPLVKEILQKSGYTVLAAADARAALAAAQQHAGPLHLLLTDVIMPGGSGRDLAHRLTELRPETKVLYMSGYTDDTIGRHGVLEHGVQFLQKPFTPLTLMSKVRDVLDR